MLYQVLWTKRADRELGDLPRNTQVRLRDAAAALATNPRPNGCKKLRGRPGHYRIRGGDFRIIYTIDDSAHTVGVANVGDRKDVYL